MVMIQDVGHHAWLDFALCCLALPTRQGLHDRTEQYCLKIVAHPAEPFAAVETLAHCLPLLYLIYWNAGILMLQSRATMLSLCLASHSRG